MAMRILAIATAVVIVVAVYAAGVIPVFSQLGVMLAGIL